MFKVLKLSENGDNRYVYTSHGRKKDGQYSVSSRGKDLLKNRISNNFMLGYILGRKKKYIKKMGQENIVIYTVKPSFLVSKVFQAIAQSITREEAFSVLMCDELAGLAS